MSTPRSIYIVGSAIVACRNRAAHADFNWVSRRCGPQKSRRSSENPRQATVDDLSRPVHTKPPLTSRARARATFESVNYADVSAAYLTPRDTDPEPPVVPDSPARRLRDAVEPIATIGWWSEAAGEQFGAAGLDFLGGYMWGRAASLGSDVEPAVVASAFGVFDPSLLGAGVTAARNIASHEQILASRAVGAGAGLAAATTDIAVTDIVRLAQQLRAPLDLVDVTARPMFTALRGLPISDDPHVSLWRAAEMYREHRGDGHLAACVAAGLDAVEMNVLTELWLNYPVGEYSATRGFGPDRIGAAVDSLADRGWVDSEGALTADGREARNRIEAATDESQRAVTAALGDDLDQLVADLTPVADAVLAAHAAPADPRKRAAG